MTSIATMAQGAALLSRTVVASKLGLGRWCGQFGLGFMWSPWEKLEDTLPAPNPSWL